VFKCRHAAFLIAALLHVLGFPHRCEFEAGQAPAFNIVESGHGNWLISRGGRKVTLKVGGWLIVLLTIKVDGRVELSG
jgi:hypothetical protein